MRRSLTTSFLIAVPLSLAACSDQEARDTGRAAGEITRDVKNEVVEVARDPENRRVVKDVAKKTGQVTKEVGGAVFGISWAGVKGYWEGLTSDEPPRESSDPHP